MLVLRFTVLLAALLLPLPALALPAISCHCFTERVFEPARPAAADPYFLATTQNSFFAAVFNTDKKNLVIKKQQGISSDDLWVAYWVASHTTISAESLLQARQKNGEWKELLSKVRLDQKNSGARFSALLSGGSSAAVLAEAVLDEIFLQYRLLSNTELVSLRREKVSNQELILAALIGAKLQRPARQICQEVKSGATSWGSWLQAANIDAKNIQREISSAFRLPR